MLPVFTEGITTVPPKMALKLEFVVHSNHANQDPAYRYTWKKVSEYLIRHPHPRSCCATSGTEVQEPMTLSPDWLHDQAQSQTTEISTFQVESRFDQTFCKPLPLQGKRVLHSKIPRGRRVLTQSKLILNLLPA